MIKSNFTDLSSNDIKVLIDNEVSKGSEHIDTDYIDFYFLHGLNKDRWENIVLKHDLLSKLEEAKKDKIILSKLNIF